ncbi:hypothetical protein HN784_04850 [bacterium]|jgi:hypothetical protein|nr:hypothetical protein [bacterium]MBT4251503.1 hypothetical protein [bacterium]MBT4597477.1 hypothetical protein [bacterium]MBT6754316.1 hypothetical protein [bacterium]MBT7037642.1 hypothetical protein [bacterium]
MYHKILADGFFSIASIAILVSIYSWSIDDIFLASAQWLQVATVMLLVAIYIKMNTFDDEAILSGTFHKKTDEKKITVKRRRKLTSKKKK